jgi:hypothetical protein
MSFFSDTDIICQYTRADALEDGFQTDVSATAREAGIRFPVFFTKAVFDRYITVPPAVSYQDEAGRLWDIIWMLRQAMVSSPPGGSDLQFTVHVNNGGRPEPVRLFATCGPMDIDDPTPVITVMLPEEDE